MNEPVANSADAVSPDTFGVQPVNPGTPDSPAPRDVRRYLEKLAGEGVRSVRVICPGFSAACLEILEEVAMENRDVFLEAGGEHYGYIPCLNDRAFHVGLFASLVGQHLQGWTQTGT